MSLDGLATAIYQRKDGQHVVSTSVLSSTSDEKIFIEQSTLTDVDPSSEHTNARAALLTVLEEISSRRAQIVEIGDAAMFVPLTVVHGAAEKHDTDAYTRMIRGAFPEYFSGTRAPAGNVGTVGGLMQHLMKAHHQDHAPALKDGEHASQLALNDFALFLPDDPRFTAGMSVTASDKTMSQFFQPLVMAARTGDSRAHQSLIELAKKDADNYASDLRKRGILESTRFVQFGLHSDEFKKSARYTYLEFANLKDVFVNQLITKIREQNNISQITKLREQYNIAVKTPNDAPSPAFADITATFLADVWMLIYYHRTGRPKAFKNVSAKRR